MSKDVSEYQGGEGVISSRNTPVYENEVGRKIPSAEGHTELTAAEQRMVLARAGKKEAAGIGHVAPSGLASEFKQYTVEEAEQDLRLENGRTNA